ncbi:DUF2934 domain-containing protein [Pluralibacter gergoviae]|uniref:DUF2934 domain-containing protein n=1 Tax=Pluralibacter gergoviae TaxID=61647 RepID=A0AAI9GH59_PLUGE|nr:DUF2934 domain-containing protein [Pluralibacter gergoviae]EKV0913323.1 DUF2934 domain-containing protein [Pluralibacter gergoviae]EKV0928420.1 DUF2934 domain-containing protein [Pluralibacter gergoviae]EKV3544133.1 DUF2934 domain-containing protein [Pluralibacter gergoviae]EKV6247395.1 DUF2934 domain-containing protein [Pluralibacter gergoviae]
MSVTFLSYGKRAMIRVLAYRRYRREGRGENKSLVYA